MLATMSGRQLRGQGAGSILAEGRAYREGFVGKNRVVFGECVAHDDRVKDSKSAREQKGCRQRKQQNELKCDGAWFIQRSQSRRLASFENIANATNGVDQLGLERIVYFRA